MKLFGFVLVLSLTLIAQTLNAQIRVRVEAGNYDREMTPVYVKIPWPDDNTNTKASVYVNNTPQPAQVEILRNGEARVWWMIDSLMKNQTQHYRLELGESILSGDASAANKLFRWSSDTTKAIDLDFAGRTVWRYIYPNYEPEHKEYTKKPFHHVFAPSGAFALTKGVGGKYSHHRGIFFGYNKVQVEGESYDIWHAHNGEHSQHQAFLSVVEGPILGAHTVKIHWNDREARPILEETRTLRAFRQEADQWLIELETTLKSLRGRVELNGDRQHAGVQFRSAQEVAEHPETTRYLRPEAWKDLPPDEQINTDDHVDLPWNAIQIDVQGEAFTVAYLTGPGNPDGARFSERLYGRFGEFIPYTVDEDTPLRLRYRWWILNGHAVSRETIEKRYHDLADPPKTNIVQ